jgi:hypothetical protein
VKIKDPFELSPDFTVRRTISLPRCVDEWYDSKRSINCSGLCATMLIEIIKTNDPEYYNKIKPYISNEIRRKETTPEPKTQLIL